MLPAIASRGNGRSVIVSRCQLQIKGDPPSGGTPSSRREDDSGVAQRGETRRHP